MLRRVAGNRPPLQFRIRGRWAEQGVRGQASREIASTGFKSGQGFGKMAVSEAANG